MKKSCLNCEGYCEEWDGDYGGFLSAVFCGCAEKGYDIEYEIENCVEPFPFNFPLPCHHPPFWTSDVVEEVFRQTDSDNDSFCDAINRAGELWDFNHGCIMPREKVREFIEGLLMWMSIWYFIKRLFQSRK